MECCGAAEDPVNDKVPPTLWRGCKGSCKATEEPVGEDEAPSNALGRLQMQTRASTCNHTRSAVALKHMVVERRRNPFSKDEVPSHALTVTMQPRKFESVRLQHMRSSRLSVALQNSRRVRQQRGGLLQRIGGTTKASKVRHNARAARR